ncbi:hypothetical protein L596_010699 [Steinernema carpocapsae]|uniref:Sphingomyelin synthase-like domain-containing protein n=1 Tax=Steinernema carpocapsae TaxID=34508 RepID=A0A4U5PJ92_STECR|nr:hypothetical protein L596_010699 [Steinernema carpocapsae]
MTVCVPLIDDSNQPKISKRKTFVAFGFLVLAWFTNQTVLAWVHDRVPRSTKPLPDLWFSLFPEIPEAIRITEVIMLILVSSSLITASCHRRKWIVLRRIFFCTSVAYFFRAACVALLQVPVPSQHTYCSPQQNFSSFKVVYSRVIRTFWSLGIEQLRSRDLCGDLIVSGHTISIVTSVLILLYYSPRRSPLFGYLAQLLGVIAIICILMARKHYTVDVVLGYFVTTRIFWTYHSLQSSYHKNEFRTNDLSQSFWAKLIPYLEADAPAEAHFGNSLVWPYTCTRSLY